MKEGGGNKKWQGCVGVPYWSTSSKLGEVSRGARVFWEVYAYSVARLAQPLSPFDGGSAKGEWIMIPWGLGIGGVCLVVSWIS